MIVTLCGSVRFEPDFHVANLELAHRGIICYTLVVFPCIGADPSERGAPLDADYDKIMLDLGYMRKIVASDAVLVLGDGYIGRSTSREILWAHMTGRRLVHQADVVNGGRLPWDDIERLLRSTDIKIHNALDMEFCLVRDARKVLGV